MSNEKLLWKVSFSPDLVTHKLRNGCFSSDQQTILQKFCCSWSSMKIYLQCLSWSMKLSFIFYEITYSRRSNGTELTNFLFKCVSNIFRYKSTWKIWMNAIDHFAISYLVPEISIFKELQHHATTTRTTTVKIMTSSGLHVHQWLKRLTAVRMTSSSRDIYSHTMSKNQTKLWPVEKYWLESFIMSVSLLITYQFFCYWPQVFWPFNSKELPSVKPKLKPAIGVDWITFC